MSTKTSNHKGSLLDNFSPKTTHKQNNKIKYRIKYLSNFIRKINIL